MPLSIRSITTFFTLKTFYLGVNICHSDTTLQDLHAAKAARANRARLPTQQ